MTKLLWDSLRGINVTWLNPWADKMKRVLCSDWLPEQAVWAFLTHLGYPTFVPQEKKFSFWPNNKSSIHQIQACSVKMPRYWPNYFGVSFTSTSSRSMKTKKKNMAIIQPSSLNKLVNNAHLFRKDNVCAKYLLWTQFLFKMGPLFPRGRGSHTWKFSPFAELM